MEELEKAKIHLLANDPILANAIRRGKELPRIAAHTDYYQALVDAIISQQLSVKAAAAIEKRFKELFDGRFPSPEEILSRNILELRNVGISRPKAGYIQDLARHIIEGKVTFVTFDSLPNEAIIKILTRVKGIGEWTAHMFLIFCMGRLDVLPVGDLGIRNGIKKLYSFEAVPTPEEVLLTSQKYHWAPYQTVASWYIWQSLDNTPEVVLE
jgi:DNA-3-methyladenine glycosylase II